MRSREGVNGPRAAAALACVAGCPGEPGPLLVRPPVTTRNPAALRQAARRLTHARGEGIRFVHVEQVDAEQQGAGAVDVHVGVVEARDDEGAGEVDDARGGRRERTNVCRRADGGDSRSGDRNGLSPRPRRLERVDTSVHQGEGRNRSSGLLRAGQRAETADRHDGERGVLHGHLAFLTGGLRPPGPLTRSLAGPLSPRSALVARSLRSLADDSPDDSQSAVRRA